MRPFSLAWLLVATVLGSSMAFIDATAVNVTLPIVQGAFRASGTEIQWIVESYQLCLGALLLLGGALGDRFGRKRAFVWGVWLFTLASASCGLAPTLGFLVASRALQGIGAALLTPNSLALLESMPPKGQRSAAIGTWSAFTAITGAFGPVLGGWLTENWSWRLVFFLNIPLAAATLAIAATRIPVTSHGGEAPSQGGLDIPGAVAAFLGWAALIFGLIQMSLAGCAIGILALLGFLRIESRAQSPMLPLSLFRSRILVAANLLTLLVYAALGGALYFLPFYLILIRHYAPTLAGAASLPLVLLMFLGSRYSGKLGERCGPRWILAAGALICTSGYVLLLLRIGSHAGYWQEIFPGMLGIGIGMALTVAPITATAIGAAGARFAGVASGLNTAVARIAALLAIAAFNTVAITHFSMRLQHSPELAGNRFGIRSEILNQLREKQDEMANLALPPGASALERQAIRGAVTDSYTATLRLLMGIAASLTLVGSVIAVLLL